MPSNPVCNIPGIRIVSILFVSEQAVLFVKKEPIERFLTNVHVNVYVVFYLKKKLKINVILSFFFK